MNPHLNDAIEILRATRDGDDLDPRHLYLVELAVNDDLSAKGAAQFAALVTAVRNGYVKPWFYGIENLTRSVDGFVLWRDIVVEHYTFHDADREREAALILGEACRRVEARGEQVSFARVLDEIDALRAA